MDWPQVNRSEQSVAINYTLLVSPATWNDTSAIDQYYNHRQTLLRNSFPADSEVDPVLLGALLLGVVSATEYFFRMVVSRLIRICPIARQTSHAQSISFGSVEYCGSVDLGWGLLENTSFSDPASIKKISNNYLGLQVKEGSSVAVATSEFGKICNIRHALVHSHGHLSNKNAIQLGLKLDRIHEIRLDSIAFQKLIAPCDNVVRAFNRFAFEETAKRWISHGFLLGDWSNDKEMWTNLHRFFFSQLDRSGPPIAYRSWQKIRKEARASAAAQGRI